MTNKLKFVKFKDILSIFALILVFIPAIISKIFIRNFWLVCERNNEARDNGYWFFKYVCENQPKQKIAYAIDKKCKEYEKVKYLGKIVQYGGIAHWFWYIVADKNISTQKAGKPNAALCYLFEVVFKLRKNNRIFLQHGIIINDLPFLYYKNAYIKRFVTSTFDEDRFLKETFGYPKNSICLTGLCRFDNLNDACVKNNQILIMPTWRQWISKGIEMKQIEGTTNFLESNYYKHWAGLLKSEKLQKLLEKHDKTLIFYPHKGMQKYIENFNTNCKNIIIGSEKDYDVQELLKESALLITDYSSVFFDFAYMKKPIIFYQFDEEKFREFQYKEGYFSYKNAEFAMWTDTEDALINEIEQSIKNNLELKNRNAVDKYFPYHDSKNCERVYQMIKDCK